MQPGVSDHSSSSEPNIDEPQSQHSRANYQEENSTGGNGSSFALLSGAGDSSLAVGSHGLLL